MENNKNLKATVAYNGKSYCGWQYQKNNKTIQGEIELAFSKILKLDVSKVTINGAGRTDAGVHALGQVFLFRLPFNASLNKIQWLKALNQKLPSDIRIMDCSFVADDFNVLKDAKLKNYQYKIFVGEVLPINEMDFSMHCKTFGSFKYEDFCYYLKLFEGEHNFENYCAKRNDASDNFSKMRNIKKISINKSCYENTYLNRNNEYFIEIDFYGKGFLYKMIRLIVGTCLRCSIKNNNYQSIKSIKELIFYKNCAKSSGLMLRYVKY